MKNREYDMKYEPYDDYCRTDIRYKDYSDCWQEAIIQDYLRLQAESLKFEAESLEQEKAIIKLAEEEIIADVFLHKFAFWSEIITIILFIIFALIKIIQLF